MSRRGQGGLTGTREGSGNDGRATDMAVRLNWDALPTEQQPVRTGVPRKRDLDKVYIDQCEESPVYSSVLIMYRVPVPGHPR
jgi:hypothetical protein